MRASPVLRNAAACLRLDHSSWLAWPSQSLSNRWHTAAWVSSALVNAVSVSNPSALPSCCMALSFTTSRSNLWSLRATQSAMMASHTAAPLPSHVVMKYSSGYSQALR